MSHVTPSAGEETVADSVVAHETEPAESTTGNTAEIPAEALVEAPASAESPSENSVAFDDDFTMDEVETKKKRTPLTVPKAVNIALIVVIVVSFSVVLFFLPKLFS